MLTAISDSKSLRHLKLSSVHLDTDKKLELITGFIGCKKNPLAKIVLSENMLPNLDVLQQLHLNHSLKELVVLAQTYFMGNAQLAEDKFRELKPNRQLEKLTLGLGLMRTVKPLILALNIFPKLLELRLQNVELTKLHFQVLDNYLIHNPDLRVLALVNVKLGYDHFLLLEGTIRNARKLRKLNLANNQLRNQGCTEVANLLLNNYSIQSLNLDNNDIREYGLVAILKVLESNRTLHKVSLENNKFVVSRQLLGLVADLFVYKNRSVRVMKLT